MNASPLILHGKGFDPYYNLAVEEVLTSVCTGRKGLYLWQNDCTVVVGRNQDILSEVDTSYAEAHGIRLSRRLSGGGAVYHDRGNLNFTFAGSDNETDIIVSAMRYLGLDVQTTGRNDIEIMCGRNSAKFSGNAYFKSGSKAFHHGTILINTDLTVMERVLTPDKAKLASHGVASVRSRVINLSEADPALTVSDVKSAIIKAFENKYGTAEPSDISSRNADDIESARQRLASTEWIYGSK